VSTTTPEVTSTTPEVTTTDSQKGDLNGVNTSHPKLS
jgi:hypothetical protein